MAWTEKRPAGWFVRWRTLEGRKPVEGPYASKGDADAAAKEFEAREPPRPRGRAGGPRPVEPLTIAQLAALWRLAMMDNEERMQRPGAQTYLDDVVARIVAVAASWKLPDRAARPADVTVAMATALRKKAHRTSANMRAILRWAQGHHGTPFPPMVDVALRPPPSRKSVKERLTERDAKACLARARRAGQLPLISCLMVYGWRPITACRLNVGSVDLKGGRISLWVKHDGEPWWHPLCGFHVDMLRPLVTGRASDEPLFVPPRRAKRKDGQPHGKDVSRWTISDGGSAGMLAVWFRRHMLRGVGTKQVRKLAISRMRAGEWPWRVPMEPVAVRLITGQKTDQIVSRYEQTNMDRVRTFMTPDARGQIGGTGAD